MHYYTAFGLTFASQVDLPFYPLLEELVNLTDIRIEIGDIPEKPQYPYTTIPFCLYNDTQCILDVQGVALYYIESGNLIRVKPYPNTGNQYVLWLLGSAMGALLHQRALLLLHGSAIDLGDNAVLLCGSAGIGKSTTASGFIALGYKLIADDICVISTTPEQNLVVQPAYPTQKLWENSLNELYLPSKELKPVRPNENKFYFSRLDHFSNQAKKISHIFVLESHSDTIEIKPITGFHKIEQLVAQFYRSYFARVDEQWKNHVFLLTQLSSEVSMSQVSFPKQYFSTRDLVDTLLDYLSLPKSSL